jgi:GNAT superfamily N-acetyltransferase
MGRVIGDGAFYFYVQDVAVMPEHQGRGVGGEIVDRLWAQIETLAPPKSFVGLFVAGPAAQLYERRGFARHTGMAGMFQVVQERPFTVA